MRRDGSTFPIDVSVSAAQLKEQRRFTLIIRDITERKLAEEKIQKWNEEVAQAVRDRTAELEQAMRELRVAHDKARN